MKILFLLGMYHPRSSANGLCCKNVVDECVRNGWAVSCVVNSYLGNTSKYELDGAAIYPIKPRLTYRITEWCETHPTSRWRMILSICVALLNKAQLLFRAYAWPYISPSYTRAFYRKAEELHRKEQFDVVVSVYTPFDSLYAGYKLKNKFPNIKFVPYYLDALAGGWGPVKWSQEKKDRRLRFWEARVAEKADAVISMESSKAYHVKNPLPAEIHAKRKYLDIPMFVRSQNNHAKTSRDTAQYKLLFVGSIVRSVRDPKTLIDALLCVDRDDITCEFVGKIDCMKDFDLLKEKMGERLLFSGFMPHEKLAEKISDADVLINIGNHVATMVPSKIFEYMSFAKPIISTYDIENEPSTIYLSKYPSALLLSGHAAPEENALSILKFIHTMDRVHIDVDILDKQFYRNTPRAFVNALEEIMEETQ